MTPTARLSDLGLSLPPVAVPLAAYVPAVRTGDLVLTSGQLPTVDGALVATGRVGDEVEVEVAVVAARVAVLNALAAAAEVAGGLDAIRRVVRVVVYVASTPDFTDQPTIANGASHLLGAVFGEASSHARSAIGVAVLPRNAPVEVELTVEV